jgi:hypothetical protein
MGRNLVSISIDGKSDDDRVHLKCYFTSDEGERLDVSQFVGAMGCREWDFILFDDFYMASVECLDGLKSHIFFDLDDFIRNGISNDNATHGAFASQLQNTVVFKDATETFTSDFGPEGTHYPITSHSELTCLILWPGTGDLLPYYEQTSWCQAVY